MTCDEIRLWLADCASNTVLPCIQFDRRELVLDAGYAQFQFFTLVGLSDIQT